MKTEMPGTLHIYLASNCEGCRVFKTTYLAALKNYLESNDVDFQEHEVLNPTDPVDNGPAVLSERRVNFNPALVWVPLGEEDEPSKAKVMNGRLVKATEQ